MKYIDIREFRELGFIQEINRLILHPCGLALEAQQNEDGSMFISGVQDYRDDPQGVIFEKTPSKTKAQAVKNFMYLKSKARLEILGSVIQSTDPFFIGE